MTARDFRLRLAPDKEHLAPLTQKELFEILRRLERADQLEEEVREIPPKLKERDRELKRLRRSAAVLDAAPPPSNKLHRPAAPAEPRPNGQRRPGGQSGRATPNRPRPDHVNETVDLTLDACPGCREKFAAPSENYERFVTELIPAYLYIRKFLGHRYWFRQCYRFVQGVMDRALPGRQFGVRLANTLVLLSMMGLPVRRI